ncbi:MULTISPECIES: Fur family transcriptional regulator [Amniculibacterium]|uniref:Fur family transcriptional regulator n=1 Tax=Amniculibacterium TaxID=2715289 RepID=UPI000F59A71B|nr:MULTISPECIES: transcriptional repressor [Amniculibacterium]
MSFLENSTHILQKKNIGITAVRILVLQEFLKTKQSLSLSDLEDKLDPSDRSTLYRTLKTFERKGIIHGVQENNTTQYLLCQDDCSENRHHDTHLHFYCLVCKKTTCLNEISFPNIHLPKDYLLKELKLVAQGICPDCQTLP